MEITYRIKKEDFLTFQLFTVSKKKSFKRKITINTAIIAFAFLYLAIIFYARNMFFLTAITTIISVLVFVFYKKLVKKRYYNHYKTHIEENYANRFNEQVNLTIKEDFIHSEDKFGEGKVKSNQIQKINILSDLVLIEIKNGVSLIIPNEKIDIHQFCSVVNFDKHKIIDDKDWEW